MPETNDASVLQNVAAILWLQFVVYVMLFPKLNVRTFMLALSEARVQCPTWLLYAILCCCTFQVCSSSIF